nr:uncharacterized protein LOC127347639 [Lolium perenne]
MSSRGPRLDRHVVRRSDLLPVPTICGGAGWACICTCYNPPSPPPHSSPQIQSPCGTRPPVDHCPRARDPISTAARRRSSSSLRRSSFEPRPSDWIYANNLLPRLNLRRIAASVAVLEALLLRQWRAGLRLEEADLFLVPVYVSFNFSNPMGLQSPAHTRGVFAETVDLVRAELTYWNRSNGSTTSLSRGTTLAPASFAWPKKFEVL